MTDEKDVTSEQKHIPQGPGEKLRSAREKAGLSQQDVAQKLFLKRAVIDDIENNRIDDNKSVTFAKGYIRNYAKLVNLDPVTLLAEFDEFHQQPQDTAKLQSFSKRVAKQAQDDRWMMVTYGLLIILIAAVVIWWYQQPKSSVGESISNDTPVTETDSSNFVQNSLPSEPVLTASVDQAESDQADSTIEQNDLAQNLIDEPVPELIQAQSISLDEPPETPAQLSQFDGDSEQANMQLISQVDSPCENESVAQAGTEIACLVFTFAQDCWVTIKDATGESIAYGVKKAGRVMPVSGQPPFDITLGAPQVVEITYNGESVDMSGFTGREIGKLTLPIQE